MMYVYSLQVAEILQDAQFLCEIGTKLIYKSNTSQRVHDGQDGVIQVWERNALQRSAKFQKDSSLCRHNGHQDSLN